jgi:geranylgeranyl reductase family protein
VPAVAHPVETDICILGAGPAGAIAALLLAQNRVPCTVLEKARFPRDKVCGDAFSGKVVAVLNRVAPRLLESIRTAPIQAGSYGLIIFAPNGRPMFIPFSTEYTTDDPAPGFVSRRVDLDNMLVEEVRQQDDITLVEEFEAKEFHLDEGVWQIRGRNRPELFRSRLIIAADGAHSVFARERGGMRVEPRHFSAGVRAYFEGVKGLHAENYIELHFLRDYLPGYFWIFPLPGGLANVGLGLRSDIVRRKRLNMKKGLEAAIHSHPQLRSRFAEARQVSAIEGFGLPLGSKRRRISGEQFMLVGDAAALIDPFTGEGIGNAMLSGGLAALQAQTCLERNSFGKADTYGYEEKLYDRLWGELKLSARLQDLAGSPWLLNLLANKVARSPTARDTVKSMFDDLSIRKRFKSPAFYLRILFNR